MTQGEARAACNRCLVRREQQPDHHVDMELLDQQISSRGLDSVSAPGDMTVASQRNGIEEM